MRLRHLFAAALFLCSSAGAQAMYCGTKLVREGQSKYDVLQACGQPAYTDSRVEYRQIAGNYGPSPLNRPNGYYPQPVILPIEIDEWVYNFGPTQLMPSLLFESGRLVKIQLLGYGN